MTNVLLDISTEQPGYPQNLEHYQQKKELSA